MYWASPLVKSDFQVAPRGGSPDSVPVGRFRMVPGTGLYVNTGSAGEAGNPGRHVTTVGRLQYGVLIMNRSWVRYTGV